MAYRSGKKEKKVGKLLNYVCVCVFGHDIWKTALVIWTKKVLSYWHTSFHRNKHSSLLMQKEIPSLGA